MTYPGDRALPLADLSGLDLLRGAMEGGRRVPPALTELGMRLSAVSEGYACVEYAPRGAHLNGLETLHGGVLATLADTAGSCAILSAQPAGKLTPTLELNVNFLRAVTVETGTLRAEGRLLSSGRRTGLAEVRIHDPRRCLVAFATVICSVRDGAQARG